MAPTSAFFIDRLCTWRCRTRTSAYPAPARRAASSARSARSRTAPPALCREGPVFCHRARGRAREAEDGVERRVDGRTWTAKCGSVGRRLFAFREVRVSGNPIEYDRGVEIGGGSEHGLHEALQLLVD